MARSPPGGDVPDSTVDDGIETRASELRSLADALADGLKELDEENHRLRARVASLSEELKAEQATRRGTGMSLDAWLDSVRKEARERASGAEVDVDRSRLRLLSDLLDFLTGPRAEPPSEASGPTSSGADRPDLLAAWERRRGTAPLSEEETPDITPESVLAGPTADAPPHRVDFAQRRSIPGLEGVRLRTPDHLYEPGWLERHAPWFIDALIALEVDRMERATGRMLDAAENAIAFVVAPLEPLLDALGAAARRARRAIGAAAGTFLSALPLPRVAEDWLWLTPGTTPVGDDGTVQATVKSRYESFVWLGVITSVVVHFAMFAFWPTLEAEDFAVASDELTAIDMPPEVEVPPPPQQIARPATPVISTDAGIEEDITIAPTTFEENPVEELPPPPEDQDVEDVSSQPTFTPFTVRPRIVNGEELSSLMRQEYPPALREAGVGGVVVVWFYIDEQGRVQDTRVHESSGYEQLDLAALAVADEFEFSPALDGDRRVPVWIQFPLTFRVR